MMLVGYNNAGQKAVLSFLFPDVTMPFNAGWNTPMAIFDLSSQQVAVPKTEPRTSASIDPFADSIFPDQFFYLCNFV